MQVKLNYELKVEDVYVNLVEEYYDEAYHYGLKYGYLEIQFNTEFVFLTHSGLVLTTSYIRYEIDSDPYDLCEFENEEYLKNRKEADKLIDKLINGEATDDEIMNLPLGNSCYTACTIRDLDEETRKDFIKMIRTALIDYNI